MEMVVTNLNSSTSVFCINPASNHIISYHIISEEKTSGFWWWLCFNSLLLPKSKSFIAPHSYYTSHKMFLVLVFALHGMHGL